jgi:hypothetical protein
MPTRKSRARKYRIDSRVAHREIDGTLLLLSPANGDLLTPNASGEIIWRRLAKGGATIETLTQAVSRHFGIPRDRAMVDVTAFLKRLRAGAFVIEE